MFFSLGEGREGEGELRDFIKFTWNYVILSNSLDDTDRPQTKQSGF